MEQQVVEGGVEDPALGRRAALDPDARQVGLPTGFGLGAQRIEMAALLLGLEVAARALHAHKADTQAHLYLLAGLGVEAAPRADVIARKLLAVAGVDLVAAVIGIPLCGHASLGPLEFPVARSGGRAVYAQYEVDGKHGLTGLVAEGAEQLAALQLAV